MKIEVPTDGMEIQQVPIMGTLVCGMARVDDQDAPYEVLFPPAAIMERVSVMMPSRSFTCTKATNPENPTEDALRERAAEAVREMIDFECRSFLGLFGKNKARIVEG